MRPEHKLSPHILRLFNENIKVGKRFCVTMLVEDLLISRPTATKLVRHLLEEKRISMYLEHGRTNWFKRKN